MKKMRTNLKRWAIPLVGIMALVLALAACGSGATATPTATSAQSQPTSTPTQAASTHDTTLIFADLSWDSAEFQNWVARIILENGMGYKTDSVYGDTLPMLNALIKGDVNVQMESWYENFKDAYDQAINDGSIVSVGSTIPDNWQSSFVIPQYVADANPGLKTVQDLKNPDYMKLFETVDSQGKARDVGCIPGWACEQVNQQKITAYGLSDYVVNVSPGSAASLSAAIQGAYAKKQPILFYYWGPTPLAGQLAMYKLQEPAYSDQCWATDKACAYPNDHVYISMNKKVADAEPQVVDFLGKFTMTSDSVSAALSYMSDKGTDAEGAARWWLKNNESTWTPWVTPDQAAKIKAAL